MNRLSVRLSLAFLLLAWLAVGALALAVQQTVDVGFRSYVNQRENADISAGQVATLQNFYARTNSWVGVSLNDLRPGSQRGRGATVHLVDISGHIVASADEAAVGTQVSADTLATATELIVGGETVGWVFRTTPGAEHLGAAETLFLDTANRTLIITAVGVSLVALGVGLLLAWLLSRPLEQLTHAVRDITRGEFGREVTPSGTDETQSLARAFNALSRRLADLEVSRRRMAADVAHELRTPVSVLRGQLEAMRDGVFPADQMHLAVAHDQTLHLGRLVDDLRLLTLAEGGEMTLSKQSLLPATLVEDAVTRFSLLAQDAGIDLRAEVAPNLPALSLDAARIRQVFDNLLANALRHTGAGGDIVVSARQSAGQIVFTVANSGQIAPADAEHMLDRFWRADEARQRDSGGSGLGLPIARQLVTLHGGKLWVETTPTHVKLNFALPAH